MDVVTNFQRVVAVRAEDAMEWGCPYCGFDTGVERFSPDRQDMRTCPECAMRFLMMGSNQTVSCFELLADGGSYRPQLVDHPRNGIPKHGLPDKRPDQGGEFFNCRPIGLESGLACFVCGTTGHYLNNISGFVECRSGGKRVVAMFESHHLGSAWLDYREFEPHYIQVKVGACDEHKPNLVYLRELCTDGTITVERVLEAIG